LKSNTKQNCTAAGFNMVYMPFSYYQTPENTHRMNNGNTKLIKQGHKTQKQQALKRYYRKVTGP